jgi:hypothetical protein
MNLKYLRTLIFTYKATGNYSYLRQARNLATKMMRSKIGLVKWIIGIYY